MASRAWMYLGLACGLLMMVGVDSQARQEGAPQSGSPPPGPPPSGTPPSGSRSGTSNVTAKLPSSTSSTG